MSPTLPNQVGPLPGLDRRGPVRWFTDCTVVEAERGRALAFDVRGLALKVARWAYRFEPDEGGRACTGTEEWAPRLPAAPLLRLCRDPLAGPRAAPALARPLRGLL